MVGDGGPPTEARRGRRTTSSTNGQYFPLLRQRRAFVTHGYFFCLSSAGTFCADEFLGRKQVVVLAYTTKKEKRPTTDDATKQESSRVE
jgi:hypothetical protein